MAYSKQNKWLSNTGLYSHWDCQSQIEVDLEAVALSTYCVLNPWHHSEQQQGTRSALKESRRKTDTEIDIWMVLSGIRVALEHGREYSSATVVPTKTLKQVVFWASLKTIPTVCICGIADYKPIHTKVPMADDSCFPPGEIRISHGWQTFLNLRDVLLVKGICMLMSCLVGLRRWFFWFFWRHQRKQPPFPFRLGHS